MNLEQKKAIARAKARAKAAQVQGTPQEAPAASGLKDAFVFGLDQAGKTIGHGLQSLGELDRGNSPLKRIGTNLVQSNEEDIARRNYQRPDGDEGILANLKKGEIGDAVRSLTYQSAESLPSVGVGVAASLGAVVGGPVGVTAAITGTGMGMLQSLGESRGEAIEKGVDPTVTGQDVLTAMASGLVELVPAGKGAGMVLKFTKEGLQEATQEGLIIGNTAIKGGEYVGEEVVERLFDAGVVGGTVSRGTTQVLDMTQGKLPTGIRTDKGDYTSDDAALVERLEAAADGDKSLLGRVDNTDNQTSARGVVDGARQAIRADMNLRLASLRKLAKATGNTKGLEALGRVSSQSSKIKARVSDSEIDGVVEAFPDIEDAREFASLARQSSKAAEFLEPNADLGGASRVTRYLDPFDRRNSGMTRVLSLSGGVGGGFASGGVSVAALGGAIALNRTAQMFDRLTNRRSRVKRYADSVKKADPAKETALPNTVEGELARIRAERDRAKLADTDRNAQQRKADAAFNKKPAQENAARDRHWKAAKTLAAAKAKQEKSAERQARAQSKVDKAVAAAKGDDRTTSNKNTEAIFAGSPIPETDPYYSGYRHWNDRTGLSPEDTLSTLEQLVREGVIPDETVPQRYREDIYSFKKDPKAIEYQEAVRQRANPEHVYTPRPKTKAAGEDAARKYTAASVIPTGSRRKDKAKMGQALWMDLNDKIMKGQKGLSVDQYQTLLGLAEAINSPAVTREERMRMINETIPEVFDAETAPFWIKMFSPLATIGNDYAIERKETTEGDAEEAAFQEKVKNVNAKKKAKKKKKKSDTSSAVDPIQPERTSDPLETTEDQLIRKAKSQVEEVNEEPSPTAKAIEEDTITLPDVDPKPASKNSLKTMTMNSLIAKETAINLVTHELEGFDNYYANLPRSIEGRVERALYDMTENELTMNNLVNHIANEMGLSPKDATEVVDAALVRMEEAGRITRKRKAGFGVGWVKFDGKTQKDQDGRYMDVLVIEATDPTIQSNLEVARAFRMVEKMVNQQGPDQQFTPDNPKDGNTKALKFLPDGPVDPSFTPILNFLNTLRNTAFKVSNPILTQIENGLEGSGKNKVGTISSVLRPVTKTEVYTDRNGKARRKTQYDDSPMQAVAHLLFQLGTQDERGDTSFYQEWTAGDNGRVYSKNGLAHTQTGDLMKGLMRMPDAQPLGGRDGLDFLLHSFGNLLGNDKAAPAERRATIFGEGVIPSLIKFADDPFGATRLKTAKGEPTQVGQLVDAGEGFFQVLNTAHEVKSMVAWARERHGDKAKLNDTELLQNDAVQDDLSENYSTDFIVQLDAANNAYQITGLLLGDEALLRSTGILPPEGGVANPDTEAGADIYMAPALATAARVPELAPLTAFPSKLRKVFKNPVFTYIYAASDGTRRENFDTELQNIATTSGIPLVGTEGSGLIDMPLEFETAVNSPEGAFLPIQSYDITGEPKAVKYEARRVEQNSKGKYVISLQKSQTGEFKQGKLSFDTKEEATEHVFKQDMYGRMSRELTREMNTMYPNIQQYLAFCEKVINAVKAKGLQEVNIPTPDGINLKWSMKTDPNFQSQPVTVGENSYRLGVQDGFKDPRGKGLAAFLAHMLDAFTLRETQRRMEQGDGISALNPIHDSYGFHAGEAKRGRDTFLGVMQELGNADYNIFLTVLEANGIDVKAFLEAGGTLPDRRGVDPVDPNQIPTALS